MNVWKKDAKAMIVCASKYLGSNLRHSLRSLGIEHVTSLHSAKRALELLKIEDFSCVLCDTSTGDLDIAELVSACAEKSKSTVIIPIASSPTIEEVIKFLRLGAKGFLALPCSEEVCGQVITTAAKAPEFDRKLLSTKNKLEVYSEIVVNNLTKAASKRKRSIIRKHGPTKYDDEQLKNLREAVKMVKTLMPDQIEQLKQKIVDVCIERASKEQTHLSTLRKELQKKRRNHG